MSLITKIALAILLVIIIGGGIGYAIFRPSLSVDTEHPPQFIQADFVDLSKIYSISKFRSGEGHDFSGNGESCRSMKHYFTPQMTLDGGDIRRFIGKEPDPATGIAIYSPVDGRITKMETEQTPIGQQIHIQPNSAASFTVRLFHVYPIAELKPKSQVKAGQLIGYLHPGQGTDFAIQASTVKGQVFLSYFDVMPDALFTAYQARDVSSRAQLIISKETRDANPLTCNGEQFANSSSDGPQRNNENVVYLSGYQEPR